MSITEISSIEDNGIYTDLLREFIKHGWNISVFYGTGNMCKSIEEINEFSQLIPVKILSYQKSNIIKKGLALLNFDSAYLKAIKNSAIEGIDLIVYPTPPITLTRSISWVRRRYNAKSYLLLKDIFPQNALDLGLLNKTNPLYSYFKFLEKRLYRISDTIGCMSPANLEYVKLNFPKFADKLEVNPNSIDLSRVKKKNNDRVQILSKYGVSHKSKVIVYGGNLGLPQGIPFLLELIRYSLKRRNDIVFLIAGTGTHSAIIEEVELPNLFYLGNLKQNAFNDVVSVSDVGLISLDSRFTIPNFPSRLLSYLSNSKPVLCLVDNATDIGNIAEEAGFGSSALQGDVENCYDTMIRLIDSSELQSIGINGFNYMQTNYNVESSYRRIDNS